MNKCVLLTNRSPLMAELQMSQVALWTTTSAIGAAREVSIVASIRRACHVECHIWQIRGVTCATGQSCRVGFFISASMEIPYGWFCTERCPVRACAARLTIIWVVTFALLAGECDDGGATRRGKPADSTLQRVHLPGTGATMRLFVTGL
jgi:hypothetical protein